MWILKPIRLRDSANLRQFITRLMVQHFIVKIVIAITLALLIPENDTKILITNPIVVIISTILVAPFVETLLLQTLPIELSKRFNRPVSFQFFAGMIPFALLHFLAGIHAGIAAGIVGGVYFSYAYLEFRDESWLKATKVVCITHCLHNVIVAPLILATASYA